MDYRILVVDDETDLCDILQFNLLKEGYQTDACNSAEEALALPSLARYDLLLLDVMMGEMSGFQLAEALKRNEKTAGIPIIFLTAKDAESDMLTGFNIGADDYISKPFSIRQVMARVRAVLRRSKEALPKSGGETMIYYETLMLDSKSVKVTIDGVEVMLTKKEYEILYLLLSNRGSVFSREDMLSHIWSDDVYVLDRTVDVNITRLRKKIAPYGKNIVTRQGFGYCFEG